MNVQLYGMSVKLEYLFQRWNSHLYCNQFLMYCIHFFYYCFSETHWVLQQFSSLNLQNVMCYWGECGGIFFISNFCQIAHQVYFQCGVMDEDGFENIVMCNLTAKIIQHKDVQPRSSCQLFLFHRYHYDFSSLNLMLEQTFFSKTAIGKLCHQIHFLA